MLAFFLLASLIACVAIVLLGWARDELKGRDKIGASCPLFPNCAAEPGGFSSRAAVR